MVRRQVVQTATCDRRRDGRPGRWALAEAHTQVAVDVNDDGRDGRG